MLYVVFNCDVTLEIGRREAVTITEKLVTVCGLLGTGLVCERLGDTIMLCKLLLFCTKDDITRMMRPLYSKRHLILCVWRGENETECSRKRARKLTRSIPGKMIQNHLLSGMFWFINWNPIFNCTGLFLPNKHALLAIWQPEKKVPLFVVFERDLYGMYALAVQCALFLCTHFFVYYKK